MKGFIIGGLIFAAMICWILWEAHRAPRQCGRCKSLYDDKEYKTCPHCKDW